MVALPLIAQPFKTKPMAKPKRKNIDDEIVENLNLSIIETMLAKNPQWTKSRRKASCIVYLGCYSDDDLQAIDLYATWFEVVTSDVNVISELIQSMLQCGGATIHSNRACYKVHREVLHEHWDALTA